MKNEVYEKRTYRDYTKSRDLSQYTIVEKESDLQIYSNKDIRKSAIFWLKKYRKELVQYIEEDRNFLHSLEPVIVREGAPEIVKHMARAARKANVGPMAAVAGAISEYVGNKLMEETDEIIIENGGDLFIKSNQLRRILVYAGTSPFSNQVALEINPKDTPLGICTSAGTVGHSLSFGRADAAVVLSSDTLLADAAATAIGNLIHTAEDIENALEYGGTIPGISGILVIIGDKMGAWGNIRIDRP